tara:strand:- start:7384 stop:8064 length:681 start_codon:yes stop_codon:yes gene_type:complete
VRYRKNSISYESLLNLPMPEEAMPEDPHESLISEASQGDEQALAELLEQHLPALQAYVRLHSDRLLRDKESCADLAQSVCREVLQSLEGFEYRGVAPFRKWLFQKALSKIVDRQRYYLADKRHPAREQALAGESGDALAALYASFCSPSQVAINNEDLARLEVAFAKLPDEHRQVVTMARLFGYAHSEIATEMGRSEGAVRVLLHRALARLAWLMHTGGGRSPVAS